MTHLKFIAVMERFVQLHNAKQAAGCAERLCNMWLKAEQALQLGADKTYKVLHTLLESHGIGADEVRRSISCCRCCCCHCRTLPVA